VIRSATISSVAVLWLLAGDPNAGFASGMAGGPSDLLEVLNMREQLFVGVVESSPEVDYVPSGSCAEGLRGERIGELVVRVTEVLHGAGIRPLEPVRNFHRMRAPVGTRVLVGAARTCADDWRLWGTVYFVGEDDTLRLSPPRIAPAAPGVIEEVVSSNDRYPYWVHDHGRRPTLTEVRTRPRGVNDRNPSRPFVDIRTLHSVRVIGMTRVAPSSIEFTCQPLAQLLGGMGAGPTRLRFDLPPGAGNRFVGTGDTLVVPGDESHAGETRTYSYGAEFFLVEDGFLPGLGVPLAQVAEVFESAGPRMRLKRMLDAPAGP
jgi:hypothetical protein